MGSKLSKLSVGANPEEIPPLVEVWIAIARSLEWRDVTEDWAEFADGLPVGLVWTDDRRIGADPMCVCAPATEQTRTPASAAMNSFDLEIMRCFL